MVSKKEKHETRKVIFGPTKEISTLKYYLLVILTGLPAVIVSILVDDITHNFLLSSLIFVAVGATSATYLHRYLMRRGIRPPGIRRKEAKTKYILSPESGQPIDEKLIKRYERALKFSDKESENYVAQLAMLGMMYLQKRCSL